MTVTIRLAGESDVIDIVRMLADDPLGATREKYQTPHGLKLKFPSLSQQ